MLFSQLIEQNRHILESLLVIYHENRRDKTMYFGNNGEKQVMGNGIFALKTKYEGRQISLPRQQ